jgi:hypothetical protein
MTMKLSAHGFLCFFARMPEKPEKNRKKREKVLAFPRIHDILSIHYALKQGVSLQFRV